MLNGWVSLDRAMLDHWCASDPLVLAVWVRLLLEANHADKKRMFNGVLMEVKRGQLVFGYPAFAKKSGVTVNQLRRIIGQLETDNMIHRQKTNKFSLISITNYDEYQKDHRQSTGKAQADHSQSTGKPQHRNNGNKVNNGNNKELSTELATPDAAFYIPTNKHGTEGETYPVTDADLVSWAEIYPAVNLESEMRKIIGWSQSNPTKRKTIKGMPKFINSWLSRAQDKGGGIANPNNSQSGDILGGTTW